MNYVFHPSAEAEHLESIAYYESKRPGLGASYLAEFERILVHVCESAMSVTHRWFLNMKDAVGYFGWAALFRRPTR